MRRYARAGFALHPSVSAGGVVARERIPDGLARVDDAGADGIATADAIGRAVRGAGHGRDLHVPLEPRRPRSSLDDRAFAVTRSPTRRSTLLAARDEEAARTVLWAALGERRPGRHGRRRRSSPPQQWAVGMSRRRPRLSPAGPLFARGTLGPLAPYLPSGAYL